jgi:hypothetical protein
VVATVVLVVLVVLVVVVDVWEIADGTRVKDAARAAPPSAASMRFKSNASS